MSKNKQRAATIVKYMSAILNNSTMGLGMYVNKHLVWPQSFYTVSRWYSVPEYCLGCWKIKRLDKTFQRHNGPKQ